MADIDIIKENVQFEQLLRENNTNTVLKDEYLIPDTHPDVQEILTVEARPTIVNKELIGDKIVIEGKVEYTVIYLAREDGFVANSVNYNQNFTNSIDLNQSENRVICEATCNVEHIEANIMNERKIAIQGIITIDWELYKSNEFEFVKDIEGNDNVEVLKKTEAINKISATEDVELTGKSMIRVGMDKPQINKILKCSLLLHKKEIKITEDKIYLGCYCKLNILYKGEDSKDIIPLEDDIYLSKEEEIDGITSDMIPTVSYEISNNDLMLEEDDLGEIRIINDEVIVKANVKIFSKENIDTIRDAYSTNCLLNLKKDEHEVGILHGANNSESVIKYNIQLKDNDLRPEHIISANGTVILTDKQVMNDRVVIEGIIKTDILYKTTDEDKYLANVKAEIPFTAMIDILGANENMKSIVKGNLENIDASIEGNSIAIKATVVLSGKVLYEMNKEFISDVIEEEGDVPEKKASITIYVVGEGDTFWNLAKKYNTTVSDLIKINKVEDPEHIEEGQKLIIPGRAIF
jgi:LysM repeat protein